MWLIHFLCKWAWEASGASLNQETECLMEAQFGPWQKKLQEVGPEIQGQEQHEEWEACFLPS